jgi:hypothetical protein
MDMVVEAGTIGAQLPRLASELSIHILSTSIGRAWRVKRSAADGANGKMSAWLFQVVLSPVLYRPPKVLALLFYSLGCDSETGAGGEMVTRLVACDGSGLCF